MRMAILHLYLFPTAFVQFFTGKINGLFSCRQFKVAWRTSLRNSERLWVLFAEEMNSLSKCHESAFPVFSLSDCGFDQTAYSFNTHITKPACEIIEPSEDIMILISGYFNVWILHTPSKKKKEKEIGFFSSPGVFIYFYFPTTIIPFLFQCPARLIHFPPTHHLFFHTAIQPIYHIHLPCTKVTGIRILQMLKHWYACSISANRSICDTGGYGGHSWRPFLPVIYVWFSDGFH